MRGAPPQAGVAMTPIHTLTRVGARYADKYARNGGSRSYQGLAAGITMQRGASQKGGGMAQQGPPDITNYGPKPMRMAQKGGTDRGAAQTNEAGHRCMARTKKRLKMSDALCNNTLFAIATVSPPTAARSPLRRPSLAASCPLAWLVFAIHPDEWNESRRTWRHTPRS